MNLGSHNNGYEEKSDIYKIYWRFDKITINS